MVASLRRCALTSTAALLCLSIAGIPSCGDSGDDTPSEDAGTAPDVGVTRTPADAGAESSAADAEPMDAAPTIHASIASFRVTPAIVAKGSSSALLADFTGVSATIDQGVGAIGSKTPLSVTPSASTVYTLTVTGNDGSSAAATASVDVYDQVVDVSTTNPDGPGSLAEAVATANAASGSTAITFTLPDPSTIELGATLVSSGTVTILGPGATKLAISGVDQHRPFFVQGGALTMSGVTLTHGLGSGGRGGSSPGTGGGGGAAGMGGAMFVNAATVSLKDIVLSENVAQGGRGGSSGGSGLANGGGGGGFGGDGANGATSGPNMGGQGGSGGELGGTGAGAGADATGDGAGGGGAGAGAQQNGGKGAFGGGGGGYGGLSKAGAGGFGGGSGGGSNPLPGMFGGAGSSSIDRGGGGGAGLGGAIFVRAGTLVVTNGTFTNNRALAGLGGSVGAAAGQAKAGAIFSLVKTVTLTGVTYGGSVAADADTTTTDNADVYLMP